MRASHYRDYVTELAASLVRINTENPPGRELEAASFFAEKAAEVGLRCSLEKLEERRGSAVAELDHGEAGPTLMLNSHLDTVPVGSVDDWTKHPLEGLVEGGVLYGRGSADAKGCLASMLAAVKMLQDNGVKIRGRLIVAAVADEEVAGRGTSQIIKKGPRPDYVVVGEPTGLAVCLGNRGRAEFVVHVKGRAAHSSMPARGVNAIQAASRVAMNLSGFEKGYGKKHPVFGRANASVTMIQGGYKSNVIPDRCALTVDWRLIPGVNIEVARKRLVSAVRKATAGMRPVSWEVKTIGYVPAVETSRRSRLVRSALQAVRDAGRKPAVRGFVAGTDLSRILPQTNAEGIILGPGELELAHTVKECVPIAELVDGVEVYGRIAEMILSKEAPNAK